MGLSFVGCPFLVGSKRKPKKITNFGGSPEKDTPITTGHIDQFFQDTFGQMEAVDSIRNQLKSGWTCFSTMMSTKGPRIKQPFFPSGWGEGGGKNGKKGGPGGWPVEGPLFWFLC